MTGFGKSGKGQIIYFNGDLALGALGADVVISTEASSYALEEDFRILKMDIFASLVGLTEGQGLSVVLGLADGELSDAEIEECLTAKPDNTNDNVPLERSHRPVWPIESFVVETPSGDGARLHAEWSQKWTFANPSGFQLFVYNFGPALSTGATLHWFAKIYGVWVR